MFTVAKLYLEASVGNKKWLIIAKFSNYEPFEASAGDVLTSQFVEPDRNALRMLFTSFQKADHLVVHLSLP